MKLEELRVERFGQFADVTVPISASGMTVLYGPNEAGKSTLLAALRIFLFGFPRGAGWDFRHPSETLAISGTLAFADGARAEVRRDRKKLRGKLGAAELSDELLRARLGNPSDSLFSTVFAFSLDDLARGGERLRDEGLRAALSGAGVGAARSPEALIGELRAQAESLFTVKGRSGKLINAALQSLKDQHGELRKLQLRGDDYNDRVRAATAARTEAQRLGDKRTELTRRLGQVASLLRALPRRDELRGAEAERARLSPPPHLPPTAQPEFDKLLRERDLLDAQARKLTAQLGRTQAERDALEVDDTLLAAASRLAPLHEHLGRHTTEAQEAAELAASLRSRRNDLARQLGSLRHGWTLDELDVLPHPLFTTSLEKLRDAWSGYSQRETELRDVRGEAARLDDERRRLRARLDPPWHADAGDSRLPVPRAEDVRSHRAALDRCQRAVEKLHDEELRLAHERLQLVAQLERLAVGGAVPSADELSRLRGQRDTLWAEARRALANVDGKKARAADGARLADEVDAAIRAADAHADELRRRSDDVAKRAELTLRHHEIDRALDELAARQATATGEREKAETAWRDAWARCGFAPAAPEAMLEWLADHQALVDADAERARLAARLEALAESQRQYLARLADILRTLGLTTIDPSLDPAAARRAVEIVLDVQKALVQVRADEERARKLTASVNAYRDEVKRLAAELLDEVPADAPSSVRLLQSRLAAARAASQRQSDLQRALDELLRDAESCAAAQEAIAAQLAAWRARAQVDDDAAFTAAAAAAARAHELDREIEKARRALAEARGATTAEAFDAALETADRGLLEADERALTTDLERVAAEHDAAHQRVGATKTELASIDGESRAASLALDIESRRAEVRGLVEQYAIVTLARELLQRQVQRFQERHQPRLLAELSSLFGELTEGRYRRVYQRLDEGGTFVAVRADGSEVTPDGMSTGTREQLYLALRLAYVRQYCAAAEPLPLVLDDVLVNFDARRARATLKVLSSLAGELQIVLFTCHDHLRAMAVEVAGVEPRTLPSGN